MKQAIAPAATLAAALMVFVFARPVAAAGLEEAQAQFLKSCGTCHSTDPAAAPRQGPNLAGIYGRKVATQPGFAYSAALKSWDEVWTEDLFEPWITDARLTRPGTVMNYRQDDPDKRALIIEYLKTLKAN